MKYYDLRLKKGYRLITKGVLFNNNIFNLTDHDIDISVVEHETGWYELTLMINGLTSVIECKDYEVKEA